MNFDTHWVHFEQKHGPQSLGAKEDALFWFKKGEASVPDVDTQKEDARDLGSDADEEAFDYGFASGKYHICQRVREFAYNECHSPDGEALLKLLETLE